MAGWSRVAAAVVALGFAGAGQAADTVVIADSIPYADGADIQRKVREECTELNGQFASYIRQYAGERGVTVEFGDPAAGTGRVLRVELTSAVSQGNAFLGHNKGTSSRGTLVQDGVEVAGFRATRYSMGGAFAGFKGSCSVLGRTVRAMGQDIGTWLADPVDDAELGDR